MLEAQPHPHLGLGWLLLAIPLTYAAAAALPVRSPAGLHAAPWPRAMLAATGALALTLVAVIAWGATGNLVVRPFAFADVSGPGGLGLGLRLDALSTVMLCLIHFIGIVILRYSRRYLDGDGGQTRYVRWFLATLAAVSLLVMANNLLLIWLAWLGTSLALHQLLTFYADRPQALIAAHKKFITSRAADVCLLAAVATIARTFGTLELDEIFARLATTRGSTTSLELPGLLLVAAACLKCAQLPFHGWLIQVMEAPTPVSALLHAGVINLGGFLMIRLAPLMVEAEWAQTLLVVVGSATAVVAALVMMTRVSIKVALAWSTCAQMGFMLLECGLGAYSLALLHLIAHSLYKAHAFLSSGSAVDVWRVQDLSAPIRAAGLPAWLAAAVASLVGFGGLALLFVGEPTREPAVWALVGVAALALTPLLAGGAALGARAFSVRIGGGLAIAAAYLAGHALFERLIDAPEGSDALLPLRIGIVVLAFGLLFATSAALDVNPTGSFARALHPRLFAGLFLDEIFTRATFRVWPARLPSIPSPPRTLVLRSIEKETRS